MPRDFLHKVYHNHLEHRRLGFGYRHHRKFVGATAVGRQLYKDFLHKEHLDQESYYWNNFDYFNYTGAKVRGTQIGPTGGIFNLDFSPDGSILGAACEKKNVLLFDPSTHRVINDVENAHEDCVNCIRFLDDRLFATCSDDTTISLWDARYLKKRIRSLRGHSNWVKNIEFSHKENFLVTSGFDGAIYLWDINRYSDKDDRGEPQKIFYTNGLMRMRLTPSWDKMVMTTLNGYIMIIHDLCLETMSKDLQNFKPNMYRLMQMSGKPLPVAVPFTPLFHAKRNRVEFVDDFAPGNDAETISSLQLHPQGWVAVSRNVSSDEESEWCCVHDIQTYETNEDEDEVVGGKTESDHNRPQERRPVSPVESRPPEEASGMVRLAEFLQAVNPEPERRDVSTNTEDGNNEAEEANNQPLVGVVRSSASGGAEQQNQQRAEFRIRTRRRDSSGVRDVLHLFGSLSRTPPGTSERPDESHNGEPLAGPSGSREDSRVPPVAATSRDTSESDDGEENPGFLLIPPDPTSGSSALVLYFGAPRASGHMGSRRKRSPDMFASLPDDARIHHNTKRLTHYVKESNQGRHFIKEVSFSPDGIVLASPFGLGVRLLSFNQRLEDLSVCRQDTPTTLNVVGNIADCHKDVVLSTAFSPHQFSLVTGCLAGNVIWHQPVL